MDTSKEQEPTTAGLGADEPPPTSGVEDRRTIEGGVQMGIAGLSHPDLMVRAKVADFLRRHGTTADLTALHEASKRETSVSCKLEIVKAIVALEQRFLVESSNGPLACAIE
jgi:hypothetical protein